MLMKPETIVWSVVREAGLEPARREASGPKPGASTNFAIPAHEAKIVHESLLTCKASGNTASRNAPSKI